MDWANNWSLPRLDNWGHEEDEEIGANRISNNKTQIVQNTTVSENGNETLEGKVNVSLTNESISENSNDTLDGNFKEFIKNETKVVLEKFSLLDESHFKSVVDGILAEVVQDHQTKPDEYTVNNNTVAKPGNKSVAEKLIIAAASNKKNHTDKERLALFDLFHN